MAWLIGLAAIAAGLLNTIQSGANLTLNKTLGQPILAALVVAATNIIIYLAVGAFLGLSWPGLGKVQTVPWWAWLGGAMGAAYVLATIFLAERLGSAIFTGFTVTAAIVTSVALDHFGLVGFKQHAAGLWRILGCVLMIGGITLVSLF